MDRIDRTNMQMRRMMSRSVQTRSRYQGQMRLLQTQPRKRGGVFDCQHVEPFGFTGYAPDGSEHLLLSFGGNRSHTIVLMAHNEKYRLTVGKGECAIYNTNGDHVHLKNNGEALVKASLKIVLDTPETIVKQALKVEGTSQFLGTSQFMESVTFMNSVLMMTTAVFTGAATFLASMMSGGKDMGSTHSHSGVQPGSGNSGGVV